MIHFLVPREDEFFIADYQKRAQLEGLGECIVYEDVAELDEFPDGLYVFTGLNRLGPATARMLSALHAELERLTGLRPLNHPTETLRRYELLRALHREGLNDFRAFGAWEDYSDVRFPAFVRPREQDGGVPELLHSFKEIDQVMGKGLLDGRTLDEQLVVEFLDTSDEDGSYRKYGAYIVGSSIFPASVDIGFEWVMRRGAVAFRAECLEEEYGYMVENPHVDQLARIFALARTEFGRADYSVKDGRIQTWEINTLPLMRMPPDVVPWPEEFNELRQRRKDLFRTSFVEAWQHLVPPVSTGATVRPHIEPELREQATAELHSRGATARPGTERFTVLRALMRPLKPILKPALTRTVLPVLAWRARRKQLRRSRPV